MSTTKKCLDHNKNVSGRCFFFQNILLKGNKKTKMLNNQILKILSVVLKEIHSALKGCEIMFTSKYSKF